MQSEDFAPHRRLVRLREVWTKYPVYFVTVCVEGRRPMLACESAHAVLREEWSAWSERHAWLVGRYVVMPDHMHFFAAPVPGADRNLSDVVGAWKEWTAKRLESVDGDVGPDRVGGASEIGPRAGLASRKAAVGARGYRGRLWQKGFFDHLLRGHESRSEKWVYIRDNPVRAGLCAAGDDWPFAGYVDFD